MIIKTPTKHKGMLDKPVEVGGGIKVPIPGTRYLTTCEVLEVDEAGSRVRAKGVGFTAWFDQVDIRDSMCPGDLAVQLAINNQDRED